MISKNIESKIITSLGSFLFPIFTIIFAGNLWALKINTKSQALIYGSFYGDALGGPYEYQDFKKHQLVKQNRHATFRELEAFTETLQLIDYKISRSPFGPWISDAPAGTITDDSRHKLLWFHACAQSIGKLTNEGLANGKPPTQKKLAASYDWFYPQTKLSKAWLDQYVRTAWFVLNKNKPKARPPAGLWGGMPTQAGQMIFLPAAVFFKNQAEKAYRYVWNTSFVDVGVAKDTTGLIAAGLASALRENMTWGELKKKFLVVDPFSLSQIPWVERRAAVLFKKAIQIANWSVRLNRDGKREIHIKQLFKDLKTFLEKFEKGIQGRTWWEDFVPFVLSVAFLEVSQDLPRLAYQLAIQFGYDTDSTAQLVGAYLGALYGPEVLEPLSKQLDLVENELKKMTPALYDSIGRCL